MNSFMKERWNIVMIDDDEDDFLLLKHGFQTYAIGVDLTWFDSPQAFLSAANWQHQPIHLLILDLYLGAETGKHWQAEFLAHECCQSLLIVIYTGSEAPGDRQEMIELGSADFIGKPSTTGQMPHIVARMMAQLVRQ